jgi:hypothetical protein
MMADGDDNDIAIEDFAPEEICELVAELGAELSPEQAEQLARFVAQSGGIDEALAALRQLSRD